MSLVPARISTAADFRSITSAFMRPSISPVIWPPIPRLTYGLPGKYSFRRHPSVIESPKNTTRFSGGVERSHGAVGLGVAAQVVAVGVPQLALLGFGQGAEVGFHTIVRFAEVGELLAGILGEGIRLGYRVREFQVDTDVGEEPVEHGAVVVGGAAGYQGLGVLLGVLDQRHAGAAQLGNCNCGGLRSTILFTAESAAY